ncbi:MAG TPA: hypothetical protein VN650_16600 [Gemmatimonadaceae bacterium]|nr:hypothetical protein [Gemmatimonadaceae bacterium]
MPDITVQVTFSDPSTFSFDPPIASLNAAGKILFQRKPASAAWTFVSINNLPSQFTWRIKGNGSEIEVDDAFTSSGEFGYTITVHDASGDHTSGPTAQATVPPMIMNL